MPPATTTPLTATRSRRCPLPFLRIIAVEAGSLWRDEKLHDFSFRLRCLGLEGDPQMTALLSQIAQQTQELELLAERQRQPDYERPWWQDGEYDSARADRWELVWWWAAGRVLWGGNHTRPATRPPTPHPPHPHTHTLQRQ